MHYVLSCNFPCTASATKEKIIQLILDQYNGSPFYTFSDVHFDQLLHSAAYRDSVGCGEGTLEFIACSIQDTDYVGSHLEKPSEEENTFWFADFIYEHSCVTGAARVHIHMGRNVLHPGAPADLSICPNVPRLLPALDAAGFICRSRSGTENAGKPAHSIPYVLVGSGCSKKLVKHLKKLLGPLAQVVYPATRSPHMRSENDICLLYQNAMIEKHFTYDFNASQLSSDITQDIFNLTSQLQEPQQISWSQLTAACPASAARETQQQTYGNYCYMNQEMAALLRNTRREQGLSQSVLAQRVNVSNLMISRLETQRVSRVTTALLRQLEQALELPANSIISLQHTAPAAPQVPAVEPDISEEPALAQMLPEPEEHAPQQPRFCRLCGAKLYEDSRFCSQCGGKVLP